MSEKPTNTGGERRSEVLGGLPRSRPHRRSSKRGSTPSPAAAGAPAAPQNIPPAPAAEPASGPRRAQAASKPRAGTGASKRAAASSRSRTLRQPPQPRGVPPQPSPPEPSSGEEGTDLLRTTVQAAAELAEIGLSASARALRRAVSRLPRP